MDKLLEYENLIYKIISKYPKRFDKDDLYQVGMIGLIDAYKHYDNSYDTKFSTYAYYYIIGEVNKYIRENSSLKVSKKLIDLKKKIIKTKELMEQKLGREPTHLELSLYLDIEEKDLSMALNATDEVSSLEELGDPTKTYDDTSPTLLDLKEEIEKLSEEEKLILKARYFDELTQDEASNLLGISQVQVSRKESKILQKLKNNLS